MAPREYNYLLTPHALDDGTKLVMATSIHQNDVQTTTCKFSAVPVKEYFGITAAKEISPGKCRYCVYYFDDPRLPSKMPGWLESHVTNSLLPSFPKKILAGAKKYPKDRLVVFSNFGNSIS